MLSFALLTLSLNFQLLANKSAQFLIAFLLCAGAAFKITWIHFALAFCAAAGLFYFMLPRRHKPILHFKYLALGATFGSLCVAPFLIKNGVLFGNPFHPAQVALFQSNAFDLVELKSAWQQVSQKATSGTHYMGILAQLLLSAPLRLYYLLIPIAVCVFAMFKKPPTALKTSGHLLFFLVAVFGFYIALWPAFYGPHIYSRFVFPLFALSAVAAVIMFQRLAFWPRSTGWPGWLSFVLLIPLVFESSLDVVVKNIARHSLQDYGTFLNRPGSSGRVLFANRAAQKHREQSFLKNIYPQHALVSEDPAGYFFKGAQIFWGSYTYNQLWRDFQKNSPGASCGFTFLKQLDVNYFYSKEASFEKWPPELRTTVVAFEPVMTPDRDTAAGAATGVVIGSGRGIEYNAVGAELGLEKSLLFLPTARRDQLAAAENCRNSK